MSSYPVNPWGKTYSPVPTGYKYENNQWWDVRGNTPQVDPYMTANRPAGTLDPGNAQTRPWWWHAQMLPGVSDAFSKAFGTGTTAPTGYRNPGGYWAGKTPEDMYRAWTPVDTASLDAYGLKNLEQSRSGLIQNMMNYARGGAQLGTPPTAPGSQPQLNSAPTAPTSQMLGNQIGPQQTAGTVPGTNLQTGSQLTSGYQAPARFGGNQYWGGGYSGIGGGYGYQSLNPYANIFQSIYSNPIFLSALAQILGRYQY